MPRRSILSASEREKLLALPDSRDELLREMNVGGIRELPDDAPVDFIRKR